MPYQLEIHLPDNDVETIDLIGSTILGSSEQAELCIEDYDLPAKLCRFRIAQGVLTVMNIGGQKKPPFKIGKQKIERGKMYILDHGDVLSFGKLEIIVHELSQNEDEVEDEDEDEDESQDLAGPGPESDAETELGPESEDQVEEEDDELTGEDDEDEDEDASEPTSLSVSQVLQQAKGESDQSTKKKTSKKKSSDSDKTSSRLIQFTQKVKSTLSTKRSARASVKAGTPDLVSKTNTKRSRGKITQGWPGIIPRLLAFALEMGGCLLLASVLAQRPEILSQWNGIIQKIDQLVHQEPQLQALTNLIGLLQARDFLAIILFGFLQILINFTFGRSLGYVLIGINEDSGFITKRIKALFRALLFFLTGPFLIFDLPILIKKRSFKEWLTRSALYRPSIWPAIFSLILFLPLLVLGFLFISLTSNKESVSAKFMQLQPSEVSKRLSFSSLELRFPEFGLNDKQLLPDIQGQKRPAFWIYYRGLDQSPIGLSLGPSYSLESWTYRLLDNSFVLPFINPELHQLFESASTPGPLSFNQRQNLERLFKDSILELELNIESGLRLFQTYGPHLSILNSFSTNLKDSLALKEGADLKWVNFLQRDVLWIEREKEENFEVQLIFLDVNPFKSLKVFVPLAEKDELLKITREELIQVLPVRPGPSPKGEEVQKTSHKLTDESLKLIFNPSLSAKQLNSLYKNYFQLTGELLGGSSNLYRHQFETQMKTLMDKLENRQAKSPKLQEFYKKMKKLFSAYQNQQSSFFIEDETDAIDNAQNKSDDI